MAGAARFGRVLTAMVTPMTRIDGLMIFAASATPPMSPRGPIQ